MARSRYGIRAALFDGLVRPASELAVELTPDRTKARRLVRRSFTRCFARLTHFREPQFFEVELFREIVRGARRRGRGHEVERAAIAHLAAAEGMAPGAIADVLEVSQGRVDAALDPPPPAAASDEITGPLLSSADLARIARLSAFQTSCAIVAFVALTIAVVLASQRGPETATAAEADVVGTLPSLIETNYRPRGPIHVVVRGTHHLLRAYRAEHRTVCFELRVEETYGTARCPSDFSDRVSVFVGPDRLHGTTYLYGTVRRDVERLTLTEGSAVTEIALMDSPYDLVRRGLARFFVLELPRYLLPLTDEEQGESLGYRVYPLELVAEGHGRSVSVDLALGAGR